MNKKLTPKIILEGTRLTFKTEIAFALNEHPGFVGPRKYRYHSPVISGEWCAFTNFPWGRGLINFNREEEGMAMETYDAWARIFELQRYYSWIVDRFHLSTKVYQKKYEGRDYDFNWLEKRLLPLGFHVAVLTRSDESFYAARERRLKVSGNPSQYDNIGIFMEEQEMMRTAASGSILPLREFDISDNDLSRVADEIVDWMRGTGGLYSN
ncbi:MAG: hypothetical protein HUU54_04410 [Ignavibacteriaceae bacterium]|nr:hypothetical protein [Ignavibacteriaceae bacterium]